MLHFNADGKIDEHWDVMETPKDTEGKRRILRSLMNIRMPKAFSDDVLAVQDEYLTGRAEEKGIVRLSDIPEIRGGLSVW